MIITDLTKLLHLRLKKKRLKICLVIHFILLFPDFCVVRVVSQSRNIHANHQFPVGICGLREETSVQIHQDSVFNY